jgi:hypothetical protein
VSRHRIINIRGCNGSGKTTIVRRFLERLPAVPLGPRADRPLGYAVTASAWGIAAPVYVVGSYQNACGGTDGIKTQEEIVDRVRRAHACGHVLVEGLLMSKSSDGGTCAPALRELGAVFAFLDTPWQVCLQRVLARRAEAGNTKPFDPDKTMRSAYEQCHRSHELLTAAGGYDVRWLDHTDAVGGVVSWLKEAEQ